MHTLYIEDFKKVVELTLLAYKCGLNRGGTITRDTSLNWWGYIEPITGHYWWYGGNDNWERYEFDEDGEGENLTATIIRSVNYYGKVVEYREEEL